MTEIGEALAKLQKQRFTSGPFFDFEQEISVLLEYIYNTQLEYAACTEDLCVTMDGSQESYRLLGNFAAGQPLYHIQREGSGAPYIYFHATYSEFPARDLRTAPVKIQVPLLKATVADFCNL
ncbi:hypothetical protein KP509_1Z049800 [Ceratopteris richardii]|nr:hypothetical protein KP509_1Z049800 [Ceratopteris richardii]